jgi:hypothetical protein
MIDYKKGIVVLTLTAFPLLAPCGAVTTALAESRVDSVDHGAPTPSSESISTGRRLIELAAALGAQGHVPILVSAELADDKIDAKLDMSDWNASIRSLLRGYNHLAIIDRGGRYRKIWITARSEKKIAGDDGFSTTSRGADSEAGHEEPDPLTDLPIAIWRPIDVGGPSILNESDIPHESVQMDPGLLESLEVGQPIEIPVPQEEKPYFGVIGDIHDQLNGAVQVLSGPIDGAHETASFTMTRGKVSTYVTVATGSSIYEVALDNATGVGSVVNEVDLTKGKDTQDALIPNEAEEPNY